MGRKPNPLILEFFERGVKLKDNSNRYPHKCKSCGEQFPKGRIDSLTNHLTRKCVAISPTARINACLALNGINSKAAKSSAAEGAAAPSPRRPKVQGDWSALSVLAEASRQVDLNEKNDDHSFGAQQPTAAPAVAGASFSDVMANSLNSLVAAGTGSADLKGKGKAIDTPALGHGKFIAFPANHYGSNHSELQEYAMQGSSAGLDKVTAPQEKGDPKPDSTLSASEEDLNHAQLEALLRSAVSSSDPANISIAAAATARLNPQLLDPQLRNGNKIPAGEDVPESMDIDGADGNDAHAFAAAAAATSEATAATVAHQPWGGISYMSEGIRGPPTLDHENMQVPGEQSKGGVRLDSPNGAKARHARARFDATRRKQVQEVRKIGACIRCKILRKTCSQGSPCDACQSVVLPRVWKSGCIRTKVSEQLHIYSAGVQIVLCQNRMNDIKRGINIVNNGVRIKISHFAEGGPVILLPMYQSAGLKEAVTEVLGAEHEEWKKGNLIMIDTDSDDIGGKIEKYAHEAMTDFVQNEASHFVRCTLETANQLIENSEDKQDDLLAKALALWSFVEIMDRERMWIIQVIRDPGSENKDDADHDTITNDNNFVLYTTVCLQIAAAAERKASAASKALLTMMQRMLLDSKKKIGANVFFATLLLLHCIEKTTWAINVWGNCPLGAVWPLERQPGDFYNQGYVIADLLKQLLSIRKAFPSTYCREEDGILVAAGSADPVVQDYFNRLNLTYAHVEHKMNHAAFDPSNPRSFELLFCSRLLLPEPE